MSEQQKQKLYNLFSELFPKSQLPVVWFTNNRKLTELQQELLKFSPSIWQAGIIATNNLPDIDLHLFPLVRLSDAEALLAERDAEIERLRNQVKMLEAGHE